MTEMGRREFLKKAGVSLAGLVVSSCVPNKSVERTPTIQQKDGEVQKSYASLLDAVRPVEISPLYSCVQQGLQYFEPGRKSIAIGNTDIPITGSKVIVTSDTTESNVTKGKFSPREYTANNAVPKAYIPTTDQVIVLPYYYITPEELTKLLTNNPSILTKDRQGIAIQLQYGKEKSVSTGLFPSITVTYGKKAENTRVIPWVISKEVCSAAMNTYMWRSFDKSLSDFGKTFLLSVYDDKRNPFMVEGMSQSMVNINQVNGRSNALLDTASNVLNIWLWKDVPGMVNIYKQQPGWGADTDFLISTAPKPQEDPYKKAIYFVMNNPRIRSGFHYVGDWAKIP